MTWLARIGRHVLMDVSPLRRSRDLRCLVAGQLLSTLGAQLTMVAVAYQAYALTGSSLAVGLVSLAQVLPLIAGALLGGSLADAADRRRVLLGAQLLTLLCSAGLAVNADTGPALWPLFALPAVAAGFTATTEAGLSAILPNLVPRSEVATVNVGDEPGPAACCRGGAAAARRPRLHGGVVREHIPEFLHQLTEDARKVRLAWLADPAREGELEDSGPRLGGQARGRAGDTAVA